MFSTLKHQSPASRFISCIILITFLVSSILPGPAFAKDAFFNATNLPAPGTMLLASDAFFPAMIKGLKIDPVNPLKFNFIIDTGDSKLDGDELKAESNKLIKYFMAALTVPEDDQWVNLSPYEKDRIITKSFGETDMGRDLLGQDYLLKQLTASLMYPGDKTGIDFWQAVYNKAQALYGTTQIPLNTFNKVWIIPDQAVVYEYQGGAYVAKSHLKVMMEEDYMAMEAGIKDKHFGADRISPEDAKEVNKITSQAVRDVILPEIEKEVNEGETFANLRQMYNSMILATWYKQALKESLLGQVYVNKNKIKGVDTADKEAKEKIYEQYVAAFKQGVYNYIKEDYDPSTHQMIPRKYFSGGWSSSPLAAAVANSAVDLDALTLEEQQKALGDLTVSSPASKINQLEVSLLEVGEKVASSPTGDLTGLVDQAVEQQRPAAGSSPAVLVENFSNALSILEDYFNANERTLTTGTLIDLAVEVNRLGQVVKTISPSPARSTAEENQKELAERIQKAIASKTGPELRASAMEIQASHKVFQQELSALQPPPAPISPVSQLALEQFQNGSNILGEYFDLNRDELTVDSIFELSAAVKELLKALDSQIKNGAVDSAEGEKVRSKLNALAADMSKTKTRGDKTFYVREEARTFLRQVKGREEGLTPEESTTALKDIANIQKIVREAYDDKTEKDVDYFLGLKAELSNAFKSLIGTMTSQMWRDQLGFTKFSAVELSLIKMQTEILRAATTATLTDKLLGDLAETLDRAAALVVPGLKEGEQEAAQKKITENKSVLASEKKYGLTVRAAGRQLRATLNAINRATGKELTASSPATEEEAREVAKSVWTWIKGEVLVDIPRDGTVNNSSFSNDEIAKSARERALDDLRAKVKNGGYQKGLRDADLDNFVTQSMKYLSFTGLSKKGQTAGTETYVYRFDYVPNLVAGKVTEAQIYSSGAVLARYLEENLENLTTDSLKALFTATLDFNELIAREKANGAAVDFSRVEILLNGLDRDIKNAITKNTSRPATLAEDEATAQIARTAVIINEAKSFITPASSPVTAGEFDRFSLYSLVRVGGRSMDTDIEPLGNRISIDFSILPSLGSKDYPTNTSLEIVIEYEDIPGQEGGRKTISFYDARRFPNRVLLGKKVQNESRPRVYTHPTSSEAFQLLDLLVTLQKQKPTVEFAQFLEELAWQKTKDQLKNPAIVTFGELSGKEQSQAGEVLTSHGIFAEFQSLEEAASFAARNPNVPVALGGVKSTDEKTALSAAKRGAVVLISPEVFTANTIKAVKAELPNVVFISGININLPENLVQKSISEAVAAGAYGIELKSITQDPANLTKIAELVRQTKKANPRLLIGATGSFEAVYQVGEIVKAVPGLDFVGTSIATADYEAPILGDNLAALRAASSPAFMELTGKSMLEMIEKNLGATAITTTIDVARGNSRTISFMKDQQVVLAIEDKANRRQGSNYWDRVWDLLDYRKDLNKPTVVATLLDTELSLPEFKDTTEEEVTRILNRFVDKNASFQKFRSLSDSLYVAGYTANELVRLFSLGGYAPETAFDQDLRSAEVTFQKAAGAGGMYNFQIKDSYDPLTGNRSIVLSDMRAFPNTREVVSVGQKPKDAPLYKNPSRQDILSWLDILLSDQRANPKTDFVFLVETLKYTQSLSAASSPALANMTGEKVVASLMPGNEDIWVLTQPDGKERMLTIGRGAGAKREIVAAIQETLADDARLIHSLLDIASKEIIAEFALADQSRLSSRTSREYLVQVFDNLLATNLGNERLAEFVTSLTGSRPASSPVVLSRVTGREFLSLLTPNEGDFTVERDSSGRNIYFRNGRGVGDKENVGWLKEIVDEETGGVTLILRHGGDFSNTDIVASAKLGKEEWSENPNRPYLERALERLVGENLLDKKLSVFIEGLSVQPASSPVRILVVDNNEITRGIAEDNFVTNLNAEVLTAPGVDAALALLEKEGPVDLVVTDYNMMGKNGEELARAIRAKYPDVKIIMQSGNTDQSTLALFEKLKSDRIVDDVFQKIGANNLLPWVKEFLKSKLEPTASSSAVKEENVGGIDLDPKLLDLQIKRDGNGVPLPLPQQPINEMHIQGFLPVILNITPVPSLPFLLGLGSGEEGNEDLSLNHELSPADKVDPYRLDEVEELSLLK